jgi:hypothetical protein
MDGIRYNSFLHSAPISDYANVELHTRKSLVHVNYLNKQPPHKTSMAYAIPLYKRQNLPSLSTVKHITQSVSFIHSVKQRAQLRHEKKTRFRL